MAVFANIGGHRINPLNVAYFAEVTVDREVSETIAGKVTARKEQIPAVEIITLGSSDDNKIVIEGVKIEAIEQELNTAMNTVPQM